MTSTPEHRMEYGAATRGLGHLGIPDRSAGWHCTCGGWSFPAVMMPMRKTGNNSIEAGRSFDEHAGVTP